MSEVNNTPKSTNESEGSLPLRDLIYLCLSNWKWILISVAVFLVMANIYVKKQQPVYTRSASLLIKEDARGSRSFSTEISAYANLGMFNNHVNVNNELASIQSPAVMLEVVKRLNLDMNYSMKGRWHDITLYGPNLPVNVSLPGIADRAGCSFELEFHPDGQIQLSSFTASGAKYDDVITGAFGDSLQTPVGPVVVMPSLYYVPDTTGTTAIKVQRNNLHSAVGTYLGKLSAALSNKESTIIALTLNDVSTQRAEDVLNAVIAVYNEVWVKDKNQIAASTSKFINERLVIIEKELGNVDSDISTYKSTHLIPDVHAASSMYMTQANQANAQILELNNQLSMARYILSLIENENSQYQLLPANSGINSTTIEHQISEYNGKLLQRNSLVANSSTQNPLVIDMDKALVAIRANIITSIENQINALNTQIRAFRSKEEQSTARIASNPTQAKYLLSVERQQKVKESLYLYLLQKREENELSQAFTAYNTRLVNPPTGSMSPTSPRKRNIMLIAFLLGLMLPVGIIIGREYLNTTVRGRKDIEDLSIPFLGEIPYYIVNRKQKRTILKLRRKANRDASQSVVVKRGKRDIMNEAFRVLRTNLEFMGGHGGGCKVVSITSFNPGSGKSFNALNLAVALAIKDKNVLLIDGDMRHGSVSAFFNSPENGMADYLNGNIDNLQEVMLTDSDNPTLKILPVGTIPPNPAELLDNGRFESLIAECRNRFDYIVIDCPPVEMVADTQIIERFVDITAFIVRAGLLERSMLPTMVQLYEEKRFKNMALILNGTDSSQSYYHGGYRYSYHYGYSYSSNYYEDSHKRRSYRS